MFLNKQYFGNISLSFSKSIIVIFMLREIFQCAENTDQYTKRNMTLSVPDRIFNPLKISRVYICMYILLLALFIWSTLKMCYFLIWLSSSMNTYVRPPQCTRMSALLNVHVCPPSSMYTYVHNVAYIRIKHMITWKNKWKHCLYQCSIYTYKTYDHMEK